MTIETPTSLADFGDLQLIIDAARFRAMADAIQDELTRRQNAAAK